MNFTALLRRLSLPLLAGLLAAVPAHAGETRAAKAKSRKVAVAAPQAASFADAARWPEVPGFIDDMAQRHGFERAALQQLFGEMRHLERVIQLVKPAPPGQPKDWRAYRARFVEPMRIRAGAAFWDEHAEALERAERSFGVPAEIIVGVIGVETIYGRHMGSFRVLDTLATLGFDYPETHNRSARMVFFRGQLEQALLYAREAGISPLSLRGSYAGAIGWPQFMPGSIRNFAVDFDDDGRIDLQNSPVDAIGSVANFLLQHGWQRGLPIAFPATVTTVVGADGVPDNRWESFIGQSLEARHRLHEMQAVGIATAAEAPADMAYGLVDLQNGTAATEYWIGTANFFAITQYNRSFFYAMSVTELGRAIRTARGD